MNRNTLSMITGLTTGMIAGMGILSYVSSNKKLKKPLKQMKDTLENVTKEAVDEIHDMTMKN